jgi:hypothetical protein
MPVVPRLLMDFKVTVEVFRPILQDKSIKSCKCVIWRYYIIHWGRVLFTASETDQGGLYEYRN